MGFLIPLKHRSSVFQLPSHHCRQKDSIRVIASMGRTRNVNMKTRSPKLQFVALAVGGGALMTIVGVSLYRKSVYPHGHRPAALLSMYLDLRNYAADHDGNFPVSAKGGLDALQQLYPQYAAGIELAGISGDGEATVAALSHGAPLDPSLTSWVYAQGLRVDDEPDLALLWESKGGLYPNGRRNEFGGHAVVLVGSDITNVPSVNWDEYLKQQEQRRNAVLSKRAPRTNVPPSAAH